jgi:hypothetical protein
MPSDERSFLDPQSEVERSEIRRLVRSAIEKEPNFHTRMKAVADLLALMIPENAHDIRDAFVNSRADGFWYGLERKVFLARYGEVMGEEALNEFRDDPDFVRALESWVLIAPDDAIGWVNELEPGGQRDLAINRLIGAFGSTDVNYAVEVFQSLGKTEQKRHRQALTEAAIRAGGKQRGTQLALDLLKRDEVSLQNAGRLSLREIFDLYPEEEERNIWLRGLPPDVLGELAQNRLPEEFRSHSGAAQER